MFWTHLFVSVVYLSSSEFKTLIITSRYLIAVLCYCLHEAKKLPWSFCSLCDVQTVCLICFRCETSWKRVNWTPCRFGNRSRLIKHHIQSVALLAFYLVQVRFVVQCSGGSVSPKHMLIKCGRWYRVLPTWIWKTSKLKHCPTDHERSQ